MFKLQWHQEVEDWEHPLVKGRNFGSFTYGKMRI
jgi:hypothetical protein